MSESVFERLENLQRIGIKLGLRNIHQLLDKLGNPDRAWASVLIAGTNGKGSVGAMLERILRTHGIRTGHYTSPHLLVLNERIRVNGVQIEEPKLAAALETVFGVVDSCIREGLLESPPTFFETLTAAAFVHFQRAGAQWGVVEVGLGGRFDATNAVQQRLSVITNIDFDHQEYLGHSLVEIAREKAGILKAGAPLVTGILPADAERVIVEAAAAESCDVSALRPDMMSGSYLKEGFPVLTFEPWKQQVRVGLRGRHQAANAGIALLAADALRKAGVPLDPAKCAEALASVKWPGRLDLLSEDPPLLADCAHNPNGVQALSAFLEEAGWPRVVLMFTAMRDKNIAVMLQRIAARADNVFLTRVEPKERCARYEELAGGCLTAQLPFVFKEDCATALALAREDAAAKKLPLVVFGSVYLIGEIFRLLGHPVEL